MSDKRFKPGDSSGYHNEEDVITHADLCFSLQETVFAMLVEITERAWCMWAVAMSLSLVELAMSC